MLYLIVLYTHNSQLSHFFIHSHSCRRKKCTNVKSFMGFDCTGSQGPSVFRCVFKVLHFKYDTREKLLALPVTIYTHWFPCCLLLLCYMRIFMLTHWYISKMLYLHWTTSGKKKKPDLLPGQKLNRLLVLILFISHQFATAVHSGHFIL